MSMSFLNKIWKYIWFEGPKNQIVEEDDNGVSQFVLMYKTLKVGILSFENSMWNFRYSDEFRQQNKVPFLVNFPTKDKIYVSKQLWPFFSSRIPSRINAQDEDAMSLVELLKKYGERVITNPYVLKSEGTV